MTATPLNDLILLSDLALWIDLALRSSIVVLVGLVVSALLTRGSAALRHSVLAAAIAGGAAVVPLSLVVPAWNVPIIARLWSPGAALHGLTKDGARVARGAGSLSGDTAATAVVVTAPRPHTNAPVANADVAVADPNAWAWRIALIWIAGMAIGAAFLMTGVVHLVQVIARAERVRDGRWAQAAARLSRTYGLRREVALLQTDIPDLLATWGLFKPRVLLPVHAREWREDRIHAVLCHELAHIRRLDWSVQLGAEALRTIYWFNPLVWIACARLRRESEQACDDAVLRAGVSGQDYAGHLLEVARSCRRAGPAWASAVPMARSSTLERRIAAMLNPRLERAALSRRAIALTAILLASITLPIAALRGAQTPQPLTGTVYDSSGAVLPGVEVAIENAKRTVSARATTDASGRFTFEPVPPGSYDLQAKQTGFAVLHQQFDLTQPKDWDRTITLAIGELTETINVRASAGAAADAQAPPGPIRVGGSIRAPRKLQDVHPVYPESMRGQGREGVVLMEGLIGRDGSVVSVHILSAQIHPDFAIAATDAVRQWKYSPTLLNGVPVEVFMNISVTFSLE